MPELRTKTDTYQGVTITVREPLGSDVFDAGAVLMALPKEEARANRRRNSFVDSVLLTTDIEGLHFQWVGLQSTDEEIRQAYECWRQLDRNLLIFWANLIYDAAHMSDDPALAPQPPGE